MHIKAIHIFTTIVGEKMFYLTKNKRANKKLNSFINIKKKHDCCIKHFITGIENQKSEN